MNGLERLAVLAQHLEHLVPTEKRRFNLKEWYQANCITSACAVGEAMDLPELQAEGLGKKHFDTFIDRETGVEIREFTPMLGDYRGFEAVVRFFGLSWSEAHHLFEISHYPSRFCTLGVTPGEVAARIRQHILTKQQELES